MAVLYKGRREGCAMILDIIVFFYLGFISAFVVKKLTDIQNSVLQMRHEYRSVDTVEVSDNELQKLLNTFEESEKKL